MKKWLVIGGAVWIGLYPSLLGAAEIVKDEATLDRIRETTFDVRGVSYTLGNWLAHVPPDRSLPNFDKVRSLGGQRFGGGYDTVDFADLNRVLIAREGEEILAAIFFGITDAKAGGSRPSSLWVDSIYFSNNERSIAGFKDVMVTLARQFGGGRRMQIDLKRMRLSRELRDQLNLPQPDSLYLTTCQNALEGEIFGSFVGGIVQQAIPSLSIGRVGNTNGYNWGVVLSHDGAGFTTEVPRVPRTFYNTCVEPIVDAIFYWLP